MKLSASKFNEKNVFRQFQKNIYFSQMSAVRTGVRAYMDATPLAVISLQNHSQYSFTHTSTNNLEQSFLEASCFNYRKRKLPSPNKRSEEAQQSFVHMEACVCSR